MLTLNYAEPFRLSAKDRGEKPGAGLRYSESLDSVQPATYKT